jgi:hypothetical protein
MRMELRRAGEYTTLETRGEAHDKVDKRKRYSQILEVLQENGDLTAKECAVIMMQKGYIPTSERNFTAPRLTEMAQNGMVEPIGKRICAYSGKRVAVYAIRKEGAL